MGYIRVISWVCRQTGEPVTANIELDIDIDGLFRKLGPAALLNKTHKRRAVGGLIKCKVLSVADPSERDNPEFAEFERRQLARRKADRRTHDRRVAAERQKQQQYNLVRK